MEPLEENCLRTDEIVCPCCGYEFEESFNFDFSKETLIKCNSCSEEFFALGEAEYYYYTRKKDEKTK